MIKTIGLVSSVIAGSIIGYNQLKYIDAPEAPVIQNIETDLSNPKVPINKIDFTSEIMEKNLLYATGFEDGDMDITYKDFYFPPGHNREFGGQSKVSLQSSDGLYSTRIEDTYTNSNYDRGYDANGNHLGYNNYSTLKPTQKLYLPDNSNISIVADILSIDGNARVRSVVRGGFGDNPTLLYDGVKFSKPALAGDNVIYVDSIPEQLAQNVSKGNKIYITTNKVGLSDPNTLGNYKTTYITSIDTNTNSLVLKSPLIEDFEAGDYVLRVLHYNPAVFPEVVTQPLDTWQRIQANTTINSDNFSVSKRGVEFAFQTTTRDVVYVDNIRFGYSNEVKITRDGNEIYSGYNTSIEDRTVKDVDGPNKISNIQSNIILKDSNTNQIKVNFTAPEDNGTEYTYTATASFDGKESPVSEPIKSIIKTGVDGYSYVIDNNPTTEPDSLIDVRETNITKDVENDGSTYYLHIKAVDKSGNAGETTHKKIELHETKTLLLKENGKIELNWTFSDSDLSNYYFKIFKKENDGEFIELIANTTDTNYADVNIADKENPSKPILKSTSYNKLNNTLEFKFNDSIDDGTKYSYYVEGYLNDGNKVSTSNIVNADISSGLKGYSYVVNNIESFTPDDAVDIFLDNKISIPISNHGNYIHIKAIDNQGNTSDTLSIKAYDDINPTLDLRLTDYRPNNTGLSIIATGQDNTAVKSIRLPDGSIANDKAVNFEVTKNGEYSFTVYDVAGNSYTKSINITNIDKIAPIIEFEEFKDGDEYKIKVIAKDEGSGISHIILPNGDKINSDTYTITVEPNVNYEFKAYDLAGNFSSRSTQVGVLETKNATSNLDIYIKSENMLSLSLNSNSITFEDFNGTEDLEKQNALELSINSSLPYEINAYLEEEIQNADKSEIMDKSIFNLKESSTADYKEFPNIKTRLALLPHSDAGNDKLHSFDFKLNGGIAHKKDAYKTVIKFEVKQK